MSVRFRVIDFETTDKTDPPENEIIEMAHTDLLFDPQTLECNIGQTHALFFGASKPLSADVRAVHHIQDRDIAGLPLCAEVNLRSLVSIDEPMFIVAHNAEYERRWLTPEILGDIHVICTFKAAMRVYPEATSWNNQALRYHLGLDLPEDRAMPPHRAGPDTFVTAHILAAMLQNHRASRLVHFTQEPRHYPTCPLTKHKGQNWEDIPADYLRWITTAADMDADLKLAARSEIDRRKAGRP